MAMPVRLCKVFTKLAVLDWCRFQTGICAGLIQSNRVKACEHSDIRKDRCVILSMAVAVRTDILNQCYMEVWTAMTDSLCILCHLTIQKFVCAAVWIVYSIKTTCSDTTAAAFTFVIIDDCFFVWICNRVTSAFLCTTTAATAKFFVYCRFSTGMLFHLTGTASAAHSDILQRTAKTCCFVTFEMT